MNKQLTLNQVIPNWMTNGIFTALNQLDVPWKNEISADLLDLEYHGNVSGEKLISPLVHKLLENDVLSQSRIITLANILLAQNRNQWNKLYNIYRLDYNPIENYSMVESEDGKDTRTDDFENNNTSTDQQWAFNSADWNNINKNQMNSTNAGTSTNQNTRTLTRSGNIGVTTSQQMIESEIELWKWNFIERLFEDVDRLLTLKIY